MRGVTMERLDHVGHEARWLSVIAVPSLFLANSVLLANHWFLLALCQGVCVRASTHAA